MSNRLQKMWYAFWKKSLDNILKTYLSISPEVLRWKVSSTDSFAYVYPSRWRLYYFIKVFELGVGVDQSSLVSLLKKY